MEIAPSLKHVPEKFCTRDEMTPFTLSICTATKYLSAGYPHWAIPGTMTIGVSELSPQDFLEDLESLIVDEPSIFRGKSERWHSQLAEALVGFTDDSELLSRVREMCLIPLQDGTWTHAAGQSIFFPKGHSNLEIPSGIPMLIVDATAGSDTRRRQLFALLGVLTWEAPEICRMILELHASHDFSPALLSRGELISHPKFLYEASWRPPREATMYFATAQDERRTGRELYILANNADDSSMSRIFDVIRDKFSVIHDDYFETETEDESFPVWLVDNFGLSKIPRLVAPLVEPKLGPRRRSDTISSLSRGALVVSTTSASILQSSNEWKAAASDHETDSPDTSVMPPRRDVELASDSASQADEEPQSHSGQCKRPGEVIEVKHGSSADGVVMATKSRIKGLDVGHVKVADNYRIPDSYDYGGLKSGYHAESEPPYYGGLDPRNPGI